MEIMGSAGEKVAFLNPQSICVLVSLMVITASNGE